MRNKGKIQICLFAQDLYSFIIFFENNKKF